MKEIEKVATEIPGFDIITYGGLPRGRSTLVAGRSGTAKSVFALQVACSFARRGMRTIFVSTEETPDDLLSTAESLSFDLAGAIASGNLHVLDLTRNGEGPMVFSGEFDVSGLIHSVEALVQEKQATALVLDSATALFNPRPSVDLMRSLFAQLISAFRRLNLTVVVTAEAREDYGAQLTTLGVEDYICDVVLVLRNLVDAERRRRSIEVHKYRRSRHYKGEFPFTITHKGLVVFPLDSRINSVGPATARYSSGVVGLDEMTSGGLLRDCIVLLRGPTGSGKTTLAGLYARAGGLRGEKVLYYGFEETKPMLLRNFAAMSMPLEELERAGHIRILCSYPEATSPEDLLVDVREGLEEHKPALVVFDSISSIEHSTSERGFRQFMVGLAALIREHSRSALLVQTIASSSDAEQSLPFLSTIPDAILLLDYRLEEDRLLRSVRVLKMRGSEHATGRRLLRMGAKGLSIEAEREPTGRPVQHGEQGAR